MHVFVRGADLAKCEFKGHPDLTSTKPNIIHLPQ